MPNERRLWQQSLSVACWPIHAGRPRTRLQLLVDTTLKPGRIVIPWFALGFVAVAGLSSLAILPKPAVSAAIDIDTVMLAMAMAALGLTTHISAIRSAGIKPLALAALLFAWLIGGGIAINAGVSSLFA